MNTKLCKYQHWPMEQIHSWAKVCLKDKRRLSGGAASGSGPTGPAQPTGPQQVNSEDLSCQVRGTCWFRVWQWYANELIVNAGREREGLRTWALFSRWGAWSCSLVIRFPAEQIWHVMCGHASICAVGEPDWIPWWRQQDSLDATEPWICLAQCSAFMAALNQKPFIDDSLSLLYYVCFDDVLGDTLRFWWEQQLCMAFSMNRMYLDVSVYIISCSLSYSMIIKHKLNININFF